MLYNFVLYFPSICTVDSVTECIKRRLIEGYCEQCSLQQYLGVALYRNFGTDLCLKRQNTVFPNICSQH